jgi:predicted HAD superfamily Cof-like phosphohydrolase
MDRTVDVVAHTLARAGPTAGAVPRFSDGRTERVFHQAPALPAGCAQGGDMNQEQQMVREFHERFSLIRNQRPSVPQGNVHRLRTLLIDEELAEFRNAGEAQDLVGVADALADMLYAVYGAAVEYGIDLEPVFMEIHRSNMSKGEPACGCRPDGKVLKGPGYRPPNVREVIEHQSHERPVAAVV